MAKPGGHTAGHTGTTVDAILVDSFVVVPLK